MNKEKMTWSNPTLKVYKRDEIDILGGNGASIEGNSKVVTS